MVHVLSIWGEQERVYQRDDKEMFHPVYVHVVSVEDSGLNETHSMFALVLLYRDNHALDNTQVGMSMTLWNAAQQALAINVLGAKLVGELAFLAQNKHSVSEKR